MSDSGTQYHIFLVRHFKPKISRSGLFNRERAQEYITQYDLAGIEEIINKPAGLPFEELKRVHCSALLRAYDTASAIFGPKVEVVQNKLFNECERKILALPLFRFPLHVWLTGARLLWMMGLNSKGIETYRQARLRARQCAELLTQYVREEKKTVLVAHGMLNLFIKKELKKQGWIIIRHDGHGYLAVTELVKNL